MSAAPSLATVVVAAGEVKYDDNIKVGALRRIVKASSTGDLDTLIDGFSRIVVEWPYKGAPSDPEAWDNLGRAEFTELITAVTEGFGNAGEA